MGDNLHIESKMDFDDANDNFDEDPFAEVLKSIKLDGFPAILVEQPE